MASTEAHKRAQLKYNSKPENKEKIRLYHRKWYRKVGRLRINRERAAISHRKWYQSHKDYRAMNYREAILDWNNKHPEALKAYRKLQYYLHSGKIKKPKKCQICGSVAVLHGHHGNYSKPLKVKWVCASCHKKIHRILTG